MSGELLERDQSWVTGTYDDGHQTFRRLMRGCSVFLSSTHHRESTDRKNLTSHVLFILKHFNLYWQAVLTAYQITDTVSKKGTSLQTEIITGNKQAVIIYGLLPINAIDSSDRIFQNLFNPSNRKM
jgi:hypothetical protein